MATVKCARGKRGSPSHEMDEYIKRKTVIDLITRRYENPEICTQEINSIPAADVAPVVRGRWEWDTEDIYRCSNCAEKSHVKEVMGHPDWDYCPSCGAKMDGGDSDEAD